MSATDRNLRPILRRALALALLLGSILILWRLRDHCYGNGVGPRGPLHCYKLNEMWPAGAMAFLSVASGVIAVLHGDSYRRMAWCQAGFGVAAIVAAFGPLWFSAFEASGVPLVEVFFALAAALSCFGTWLGRPRVLPARE